MWLLLKSFTTKSTTPPNKLSFVSPFPKSATHPIVAIPAKPPELSPPEDTVNLSLTLTLQFIADVLAIAPAKPPWYPLPQIVKSLADTEQFKNKLSGFILGNILGNWVSISKAPDKVPSMTSSLANPTNPPL